MATTAGYANIVLANVRLECPKDHSDKESEYIFTLYENIRGQKC